MLKDNSYNKYIICQIQMFDVWKTNTQSEREKLLEKVKKQILKEKNYWKG